MKIYAIGYENINGKYYYYLYTCKFLSKRRLCDESFYEELKSTFTVSHNKNNFLSGMYFDNHL